MRPGQMLLRGTLLLGAAMAAACSGPDSDQPADATAKTEYMTVGVFNSADSDAGTVNLSHEPVPSADWPAMTMDFKLADPSEAKDLTPGQRVDIHFTIQSGMNATVTYLEPID